MKQAHIQLDESVNAKYAILPDCSAIIQTYILAFMVLSYIPISSDIPLKDVILCVTPNFEHISSNICFSSCSNVG